MHKLDQSWIQGEKGCTLQFLCLDASVKAPGSSHTFEDKRHIEEGIVQTDLGLIAEGIGCIFQMLVQKLVAPNALDKMA